MMQQPTLSVIIVTWNVGPLLLRTLERLPDACAGLTWETIVVDNASGDGSQQAVRAAFPAVTYLYNDSNPGYAKANNQGLARAQGDFLLLLNPDTEPEPGSLAGLVQFLHAHPAAGIVGPALVLADGAPQPFAFGRDPTVTYLLRRNLRRLLHAGPLHDWGAAQAARGLGQRRVPAGAARSSARSAAWTRRCSCISRTTTGACAAVRPVGRCGVTGQPRGSPGRSVAQAEPPRARGLLRLPAHLLPTALRPARPPGPGAAAAPAAGRRCLTGWIP
ncbi:MAG: glycosyltransferase [Anaerolineae bacterium]|uniref:glycosyltransferase n=1 Tax=Candidatus Amarolinea dominans TaxID=3140696 RepID=UPI003134DE64|nr:glycosyltransferase [Anaerolineae bacterium]